jgi:DNA adenine methylase
MRDVPQKPTIREMGMLATDLEARHVETLKAPFPWFGGKSRAADLIWRRLGDVDTYNEPFAGSLAVLLGRPNAPRVETVNDLDAYLANFWRALQRDPEGVAYWADFPVNETDLHARHQWLVRSKKARAEMERVKRDPDYFNAKIAGWWVWGQCLWIGSGWCQRPDWTGRGVGAAANRGIHAPGLDQKRPKLYDSGGAGVNRIHRKRMSGTGNGQGVGVHRVGPKERRWQGGGQGGGSGVHAPRLSQQAPAHNNGYGNGALSESVYRSGGLYDYLAALAARLRRVRVCCGDWKRVLTPSVTTYVGLCGVVLDPPYSHELRERCYSEDHDISAEVRQWAIDNGSNPEFRIALCGYEEEHAKVQPALSQGRSAAVHGIGDRLMSTQRSGTSKTLDGGTMTPDPAIPAAALVREPETCGICRMQNAGVRTGLGHWKWHNLCRAELNPVALYAFVSRSTFGEAGKQIAAHIAAVAGMDVPQIEQEIASWDRK